MARITVWRVLLGLGAAALLAACVETSGPTDGGSAGAVGAATKLRPGEEVEAPDVFQANESALWDGRPSLGGVWVASPDAVDPERVLMFNPSTGKSVKGALFRRERDNPGPRLQLSSDAAEALGVIAGMPVEIKVTALRKVEAVEDPALPAEDALAAEPAVATVEGEEPAQGEDDAASVAAAALDAVGAGAVVAAGEDPAVAAEEAPKRKTAKEKRAEAKAAREAKKAADAAAAAAAAGADVGTEAVEGEAAATPEAVAVSDISSAPLDARQPGKVEGADDTAAAVEASDAASVAVDPAPSTAGGAARTIQIASFSKEENATRAIEALSKIGIVAQSRKVEKDGKVFWGVVATGDDSLLKKIKDAGFADAYFLK